MGNWKFGIGLFLAFGLMSSVSAGTYNVTKWGSDNVDCGASTSPCLTIQQAIDNSDGNDKIVVFPGTYTENIEIEKDGTKLESVGGRYATIIETADTSGVSTIIAISADKVQIGKKGKGFSIIGSGLNVPGGFEIGIWAQYGSNYKIEGNLVTDALAGIYVQYASKNQIRNNIVENNYFGGIACESCSQANISDNESRNNHQHGYAFYVITGSSISNNIASGNGFNNDENGFFFTSSSTSNKLIANVAYDNGGDGIEVENTDGYTISGNIATANGHDGFNLDQATDTNKSPSITSNSAISNVVDGFFFQSVLTQAKFDKNSAIQNSIGILHNSVSSVGFNSFKSNNTYASGSGTGLFLYGPLGTIKPIKHFYGSASGPDDSSDGDGHDTVVGSAIEESTFSTKENKFASTKAAGL